MSVVKFLEYRDQSRITTGTCTSKLRNQETNYSEYDYDYCANVMTRTMYIRRPRNKNWRREKIGREEYSSEQRK
jgi:hypothetical protein